MTDAISRRAVLDRLDYYISHSMGPGQYAYKVAHREVETTPALDAVPVMHGRWIWDEVSYDYTCSSCKCSFDYSSMYGLFDHGFEYAGYCPNCGARMDGEAE